MSVPGKQRRHQHPERRAITQCHRHAQRHAQIAHRQSERQPAETPHRAPEVHPIRHCSPGCLVQDGERSLRVDGCQNPWRDDPTEKPSDQPVNFPSPLFNAAIRHIKTSGSQAAEPVKKIAEKRIWSHGLGDYWLSLSFPQKRESKYFFFCYTIDAHFRGHDNFLFKLRYIYRALLILDYSPASIYIYFWKQKHRTGDRSLIPCKRRTDFTSERKQEDASPPCF